MRHRLVVTTPVGARPWGIALTPDGRKLYTANGPSNNVTVLDTETMQVTKIPAGELPWGIASAGRRDPTDGRAGPRDRRRNGLRRGTPRFRFEAGRPGRAPPALEHQPRARHGAGRLPGGDDGRDTVRVTGVLPLEGWADSLMVSARQSLDECRPAGVAGHGAHPHRATAADNPTVLSRGPTAG